MASMLEMVEAHLLNVEREIHALKERKVLLDQDLEKMEVYLSEGRAVLLEAKSSNK